MMSPKLIAIHLSASHLLIHSICIFNRAKHKVGGLEAEEAPRSSATGVKSTHWCFSKSCNSELRARR